MQFSESPIDFARALLVFVHIPKTAGTAFLEAFDRGPGPGQRLETRMEKIDRLFLDPLSAALKPTEQSIKNAARALLGVHPLMPSGAATCALETIKLLSGHVTLGHEPKTKRRPLYVTLVRDPVERFISHYYYLRDLGPPGRGKRERQPARIFDFEDFVDSLAAGRLRGPTNVQCLYLAGRQSAEAARRVVDEKIFLAAPSDRLEQFLELLSKPCGWGVVGASRSNEGRARRSAERPSPRTIDKIRTLVEEDIKLADYVTRQFDLVYRGHGRQTALS